MRRAEAQVGNQSQRSATQRQLREVAKQIEKVIDGIATVGISKALRERLLALERQRDDLESRLRLAKVEPVALAPRVIERWRAMIDDMENLARRPSARPEDVEEAREWLAARLGTIRMLPEQGRLVAEVGLRIVELEPYVPVVAGGGFVRLRQASLRGAA